MLKFALVNTIVFGSNAAQSVQLYSFSAVDGAQVTVTSSSSCGGEYKVISAEPAFDGLTYTPPGLTIKPRLTSWQISCQFFGTWSMKYDSFGVATVTFVYCVGTRTNLQPWNLALAIQMDFLCPS